MPGHPGGERVRPASGCAAAGDRALRAGGWCRLPRPALMSICCPTRMRRLPPGNRDRGSIVLERDFREFHVDAGTRKLVGEYRKWRRAGRT